MEPFKIIKKNWHKQTVHILSAGERFYTPLLLLLLAGHCAMGQFSSGPASSLPAFSFTTAGGGVLTPAGLPRGKLVFFAFVDPDCEHCQRAVGHMDTATAQFGRVAFYIVSSSGFEKLRAFLHRFGPRLRPVLLQDAADSRSMLLFRPERYPALFLYSPDKRLLDYEDNADTVFRILRSIRKFYGM